jgi:hypothetical protein
MDTKTVLLAVVVVVLLVVVLNPFGTSSTGYVTVADDATVEEQPKCYTETYFEEVPVEEEEEYTEEVCTTVESECVQSTAKNPWNYYGSFNKDQAAATVQSECGEAKTECEEVTKTRIVVVGTETVEGTREVCE